MVDGIGIGIGDILGLGWDWDRGDGRWDWDRGDGIELAVHSNEASGSVGIHKVFIAARESHPHS